MSEKDGSGSPSREEVTRLLAELWRETLNMKRDVGPDDNFLDLGGNSLAAMQIVARVNTDLDVEVPMSVALADASLQVHADALYSLLEDKKRAAGR